jgi:hypothetical protein
MLENKSDNEALFAQHKKQSEGTMQIVVAVFAAIIVYTLYIFLYGD